MTPDDEHGTASPGWSYAATRNRQLRQGARLTPSQRLAWLEEMLDELLPLVGRARDVSRGRTSDAPP
jgi:hypothetical protein